MIFAFRDLPDIIHVCSMMPPKNFRTCDARSRQEWRNWLQEHHDSEPGIWLVFHKQHTAEASISYDAAVEEALCFGWIDSIVMRLDDDRYARKFTPRKPDSRWSTTNRLRYADLKSRRLLAAPGLERAPTSRSGDAPRPSASAIPPYIEKQLRANALAWEYFERLAPSCRRQYVGWIDSAKREETKEKRLREAIGLLAAGKKLGLK
ncbi:MAG: YdeI/OmpD-associated family protein [Acidobacteriota bacterium]|nr:YdeI/OmpD-associated family protein [Acidobacteriota bacterium]